MNAIVIYKTKYGSTKTYAEWISETLGCDIINAKELDINSLDKYDTIIYGGGLYAEVINGVSVIVKNFDKLRDKKIVVYTTGITPIECRDYYDTYVTEKNFPSHIAEQIKIYNFPGKMLTEELTLVHRAALKTLKKIMSAKENPTEMEKLLVDLCDVNDDLTDKDAITDLVLYVKE